MRVSDKKVFGGPAPESITKASIDAAITKGDFKELGIDSSMTPSHIKVYKKLGILPGEITIENVWDPVETDGAYKIIRLSGLRETIIRILKEDPDGDYKKYCN